MEEVSVQEFYQFLTEKYKDLFGINQIKNKDFNEIIHEIFKDTVIRYITVIVLFQVICDVTENFKNSEELFNNCNKNEKIKIKIFMSYIYKIIKLNNINIRNLRIIADRVKP